MFILGIFVGIFILLLFNGIYECGFRAGRKRKEVKKDGVRKSKSRRSKRS